MAAKKKYQDSIALGRRIQGYPPPKYFGLFRTYVTANEMKDSEAICLMIRSFFDKMDDSEKMRLQRIAAERRS